jgi:hypothetical protein
MGDKGWMATKSKIYTSTGNMKTFTVFNLLTSRMMSIVDNYIGPSLIFTVVAL